MLARTQNLVVMVLNDSQSTIRQSEFMGIVTDLLAMRSGPVAESSPRDRRAAVAELFRTALAESESSIPPSGATINNRLINNTSICPTRALTVATTPFAWKPAFANRRITSAAINYLVASGGNVADSIDAAIAEIINLGDSLGRYLNSINSGSDPTGRARLATYRASAMTGVNRLLDIVPLDLLVAQFDVKAIPTVVKLPVPVSTGSGRVSTFTLEGRLDLQISARGSSDSTVFVTVSTGEPGFQVDALASLLQHVKNPKGLILIDPSSGRSDGHSFSRSNVTSWVTACIDAATVQSRLNASDDGLQELFRKNATPSSSCKYCENVKFCQPGQLELEVLSEHEV